MAFQIIPTDVTEPAYQFTTILEQQSYTLNFYYAGREAFWFMDILDSSQTPILMGIKLLTGLNLTGRYRIAALPPGFFYCIDTTNTGQDPSKTNFGQTVLLVYVESGTLSAGVTVP